MKRLETEIAIVGAGPAGLSAAIEAGKSGAKVVLIDENAVPGGQLFKQIHKFFGSKEHKAGTRGFEIGQQLLDEVAEYPNVTVMLDTLVFGFFPENTLGLVSKAATYQLKAKKVILATGAQENYIAFPGSTLPGVMGAGAAQTMININRVLPGRKVVMLGSGNVGLIVSYQLLQAGADVCALVEAAPNVGGYGVHAAKIARAGVPILTSHTVARAVAGEDGNLSKVVIAQVDSGFRQIPGTEREIECDTLCLAVGLNPMTELAWMAGCKFTYVGPFGGHIPLHDMDMRTSDPDIFAAGDISGVEEASSAIEEGRLAGIAAAESLGYIGGTEAAARQADIWATLGRLRAGRFGQKRAELKAQMLQSFEKLMTKGGDPRG